MAVTPPPEAPPSSLPPPKKPPRPAPPRPEHCLNCGTPATGNFCAQCGQENEDQTVAVKLLVSDFLSDLASFDSRMFRTLVPLFFRPGFLTNQYNAGKRVRYLSPFKLYLTMSVLFFIVLPLVQHGSLVHLNPADSAQKAQTATHAALQSAGKSVAADPDISDAKADLREEGINTDVQMPRHASLMFGSKDYDLSHLPNTVAEYDARQRDPHVPHDPRYVQYILRQIIKLKGSPQALSAALLENIPRMMFVLLPAFALSLKLVYLRSKRLYIEHLIFALHLHAFLFLLLTLLLVIRLPAFDITAGILAALYPLIAMRVVYRQGWGKTFLKYNLLAINYLFLLTFTLLGALAVAFLAA